MTSSKKPSIPLTKAALRALGQGRSQVSFLQEHYARDPWDYPPPAPPHFARTSATEPPAFMPTGEAALAQLPYDLKFKILLEASRIDPHCAFSVALTCRILAHHMQRDPFSGLKQVIYITRYECREFVRALESIRQGRTDGRSVKGLFHTYPAGDPFCPAEIEWNGAIFRSMDLSDQLFEACPNSYVHHNWCASTRSFPRAVDWSPRTGGRHRGDKMLRLHAMRPHVGANGGTETHNLEDADLLRWTRPIGWHELAEKDAFWYYVLVERPKRRGNGAFTFIVELSPRATWEQLCNMARLVERTALRYRKETDQEPAFFVNFIHHLLDNCVKGHEWTEMEAHRQCARSVSGKPSWWSASDLKQITVQDAINAPSPISIAAHGAAQNVLLWDASWADDAMGIAPDDAEELKRRRHLLKTESPWIGIEEGHDDYWPTRPSTPEKKKKKKDDDADYRPDGKKKLDTSSKKSEDSAAWDQDTKHSEDLASDEKAENERIADEYHQERYRYGPGTPSEDDPWETPPPELDVWIAASDSEAAPEPSAWDEPYTPASTPKAVKASSSRKKKATAPEKQQTGRSKQQAAWSKEAGPSKQAGPSKGASSSKQAGASRQAAQMEPDRSSDGARPQLSRSQRRQAHGHYQEGGSERVGPATPVDSIW